MMTQRRELAMLINKIIILVDAHMPGQHTPSIFRVPKLDSILLDSRRNKAKFNDKAAVSKNGLHHDGLSKMACPLKHRYQ